MKSIRSFADVVRDWLEAVNDNAEVLASAAPQHEALQASLAALRAKRTHQASCTASRQEATQDLAVLRRRRRSKATEPAPGDQALNSSGR